MSTPFYEDVTNLLRADPAVRQLGFVGDDIAWYGKGADHNDLMQVTRRQGWMIPADDAHSIGYKGVWVHYESCYPGHWCMHCELFPRLSKEAKQRINEYPDVLELKKEITVQLRQFGEENNWPELYGAHLKRTKPDPADPSSLIVWTFDLGLDKSCSPNEFVEAIVPVMVGTAPTIDEFARPLAS